MNYTIRQLSDYLYQVNYKSLTEAEPTSYNLGGCSSFVSDGKLHRNFDWDFSEDLTFAIKCPDFKGTAFGKLSDIESLPYKIVDGENNHGIMIATHILFNDWGWNGDGDIPLYKLPYIALTTMETIDDVYNLPLDNLSQIPMLAEKEYLAQFIVTDGETTYILSPDTESNNYIVQDATNNPKLANFYWVDEETVDRSDLQDRPTGVERWNLMPCDLTDIAFTKAYESPDRLSEFIGIDGTTKDSTDEELTAIYNKAHQLYSHRIRDGKTWQTMHSIVYGSDGFEEFHIQENWNRNYAREIMSDLPNPNQSRTESYLGVIVGQEGAVQPERPLSRVEQYLEYIIEHGSGGGGDGSKVRMRIDPDTYVLTLDLLNKNDEVVSTTSVDLPLEEMIVSGRYDATTKKLILTLKNGETIEIPVADLVSGLMSTVPDATEGNIPQFDANGGVTDNGMGTEETDTFPILKSDSEAEPSDESIPTTEWVVGKTASKLTEPSTGLAVGKMFRIKEIDENGHAVLETMDVPTAPIQGVQVAGADLVPDGNGKVNVPIAVADSGVAGVVKGLSNRNGVYIDKTGTIKIEPMAQSYRTWYGTSAYNFVVTGSNIDLMVKDAMADGLGNAWTDSEKTGAWKRLNTIKSTIDSVLVAGAKYLLGTQSTLSLTLPTDAELGQQIEVVFASGATACTLTCSLTGFDFVPKANTTNKIVFELIHKADPDVTGDEDEWVVEIKEG